ncbi:MAG: hypothetical protein J7604_18180 [Sporocytophaga sp.]|uniref:hypothetical protein n=1 Tax=Sporocytophaga sp. TaxID=2231183 RepID=UPI001B2E33CB|nr:hypothetical protein [Sporocytophaga sp.]MBO9702143.1 hypothetical protein [Sporocytophaga sp.]
MVLLFSCEENREDKIHVKKNTPKALQNSDELYVSSFESRGKENLVSDLYQELMEKNSELRKLEESRNEFNERHQNYLYRFDEYDSKSQQYYRDANSYVNAINDSILRKKIEHLLTRNEEKYKHIISKHTGLQNDLSKLSSTIEDRLIVLKVLLTLEQIEKYEKDNLPDRKEPASLIRKGGKVSSKLDSLTPKY